MTSVLVVIHIIAMSVALGGRIVFIPSLNRTIRTGLNERLDELLDIIPIPRYADMGLIAALITGILLFLVSGYSLTDSPWSFKLKLVALLLLLLDVGAFHIAQSRITQHYDAQMVPAIQRLNNLAVILMSAMVLFAIL